MKALLFAALLVVSARPAMAQPAVDPLGRWLGSIQAPFGEVSIELNFVRTRQGALAGTFETPKQGVALPLAAVTLDGNTMTFELRATAGGGTFNGTLSSDGKAIAGNFNTSGVIVPFVVARSGDARADVLPVNAPIAKAFEGTWSATLVADGNAIPVVLTLVNETNQTATGTLVNATTGLELPLTMKQEGEVLSLTHAAVGPNFFSGTVNAEGNALVGTFTQASVTVPLTFARTTNR
jgi:hypothetical protein